MFRTYYSLFVFTLFGCANAPDATQTKSVYTGSTPCNVFIKNMLDIPVTDSVDFVIWDVNMDESDKTFELTATYGIAQPNTPGHYDGGKKKHAEGQYNISKNATPHAIYTLTATELGNPIKLKKYSEDVFHFTDNEEKLLVGNGGWSYMLNRLKSPL